MHPASRSRYASVLNNMIEKFEMMNVDPTIIA